MPVLLFDGVDINIKLDDSLYFTFSIKKDIDPIKMVYFNLDKSINFTIKHNMFYCNMEHEGDKIPNNIILTNTSIFDITLGNDFVSYSDVQKHENHLIKNFIHFYTGKENYSNGEIIYLEYSRQKYNTNIDLNNNKYNLIEKFDLRAYLYLLPLVPGINSNINIIYNSCVFSA